MLNHSSSNAVQRPAAPVHGKRAERDQLAPLHAARGPIIAAPSRCQGSFRPEYTVLALFSFVVSPAAGYTPENAQGLDLGATCEGTGTCIQARERLTGSADIASTDAGDLLDLLWSGHSAERVEGSVSGSPIARVGASEGGESEESGRTTGVIWDAMAGQRERATEQQERGKRRGREGRRRKDGGRNSTRDAWRASSERAI